MRPVWMVSTALAVSVARDFRARCVMSTSMSAPRSLVPTGPPAETSSMATHAGGCLGCFGLQRWVKKFRRACINSAVMIQNTESLLSMTDEIVPATGVSWLG